jgi:hypothetical protein
MMFLLRKHCKEGASIVTHFWVSIKNEKIQKNIYIKKYLKEIQKII